MRMWDLVRMFADADADADVRCITNYVLSIPIHIFFATVCCMLGLVLKITPRPRHFETISPSPSLCIFEKSGPGPGKTD